MKALLRGAFDQRGTTLERAAGRYQELTGGREPPEGAVSGAGLGTTAFDLAEANGMQLSLSLNICATSLLAHRQDGKLDAPPMEASGEASTMLVEVRDNLVVAFRAANEALQLSLARSPKAWFRRAAVFEELRDYRNAVLDLDEVFESRLKGVAS